MNHVTIYQSEPIALGKAGAKKRVEIILFIEHVLSSTTVQRAFHSVSSEP